MTEEETDLLRRIADSLENLTALIALGVQRGASKNTIDMATRILQRIKEQQRKRG